MVLAFSIAVLPAMTHCKSTGDDVTTRMPCQQSARAELAVGIPLGVVGGAALFTRKKGLLGLSFIAVALGVSAFLIPDVLVGVCPGTIMRCDVLMKPILNVLGVATVLVGLVGLVAFRGAKE